MIDNLSPIFVCLISNIYGFTININYGIFLNSQKILELRTIK